LAGINQELGYETGDEILRRVAKIFSEVAPNKESLGRFGGQRFGLSLENTKPKAAREVAQRICNIIKRSRFVVGGRELTLTVDIGLVSCPTDIKDWPQLVDYTQQLFKLAAKRGENQVCTFHDLF
jgi:diguanylate cyclase (GGDEF)-like protein